MRIPRIDDAIERCGRHISTAEAIDKEVEILLAQSLLILICAEFEKKFRALIMERCSSVTDKPVNEYIGSYTQTIFRSLQINAISDTLARFGPMHREEFKRRRDENKQAETMYSSIVADRNKVAHGEGSDATLKDVKQFYEGGHVLLDYFKGALFWTEDNDTPKGR